MQSNNKNTSNFGISKKYLAVFFAAIVFILAVCILFLSAKKSRDEKKDALANGTTDGNATETTGSPADSEQTPTDTVVSWGDDLPPLPKDTSAPESTSTTPDTTTSKPVTTAKPVTSTPPVTTTPPVNTTPPTPIDRPDNITYPLPASAKVDDSYFADAVFIGDSRSHRMALYSGVKSTYYHATSLTALGALTNKFVEDGGTKVTIFEALKNHPELKKIYVSFGVNEHWMNADVFKGHYEKLIDEILKVSPHAEIYIQALLPVSPPSTVSQANLDRFNEKLLEIAKEKKVYFIDVSEPFVLADGKKGLTSDISTDGVHLNTKGVKLLFDYIRTHTAK